MFDGVRELFAAGEYWDSHCIQIGPVPEPPPSLPDGTPDHASWCWYRTHKPVEQRVDRCSADHSDARDHGGLAAAQARHEGDEVLQRAAEAIQTRAPPDQEHREVAVFTGCSQLVASYRGVQGSIATG